MSKTNEEKAAEVREEISQALSAYLQETDPGKQSVAGFAQHLSKD